jgi:sulfur transfer complex TusBCD TusB component (DsrH family)
LLTVLNVSRSHRFYGKTAAAVQANLFALADELYARDILLKLNGDILKVKMTN